MPPAVITCRRRPCRPSPEDRGEVDVCLTRSSRALTQRRDWSQEVRDGRSWDARARAGGGRREHGAVCRVLSLKVLSLKVSLCTLRGNSKSSSCTSYQTTTCVSPALLSACTQRVSAHSRLGRLRAKVAATPLPRPVEVGDRRSSVCASREGLRHGDHLVPRAAGSASWPGEGGPEREFATPPYRSTPPLATTGKKMAPCPSIG